MYRGHHDDTVVIKSFSVARAGSFLQISAFSLRPQPFIAISVRLLLPALQSAAGAINVACLLRNCQGSEGTRGGQS